jgi:putative ABC transport system permease protein
VPSLLAALLAGLVLLTLFHALIVSIQSRRRDLAILRALGADGRWVGRAVHWQASVLTAVPLIAGIPIGLVAGSVAFRAFSGAIGAVPDPTLPLALIAASLVALVVVANAVAVVPSRRARGVATAALLKME